MRLGKLGEAILEWIYPSDIYCICCGGAIGPDSDFVLCEACQKQLHWVGESRCARCGKPMGQVLTQDFRMRERRLCRDCLQGRVIRKGYTALIYDGAEREMLHRFKFENQPCYGKGLAAIMEKSLEGADLSRHVIVPVPMHRERFRQRGYNQAQLLAKHLAKRTGRPLLDKCLIRTRATAPMMALDGRDRRQNVSGVFAVPLQEAGNLAGRSVLLVDDIYTTGSTADACAKVLLAAGAESVSIVTAASGYGSWV